VIWLVIVLVVAAFVLVTLDARRGQRRSDKAPRAENGSKPRSNKTR